MFHYVYADIPKSKKIWNLNYFWFQSFQIRLFSLCILLPIKYKLCIFSFLKINTFFKSESHVKQQLTRSIHLRPVPGLPTRPQPFICMKVSCEAGQSLGDFDMCWGKAMTKKPKKLEFTQSGRSLTSESLPPCAGDPSGWAPPEPLPETGSSPGSSAALPRCTPLPAALIVSLGPTFGPPFLFCALISVLIRWSTVRGLY